MYIENIGEQITINIDIDVYGSNVKDLKLYDFNPFFVRVISLTTRKIASGLARVKEKTTNLSKPLA